MQNEVSIPDSLPSTFSPHLLLTGLMLVCVSKAIGAQDCLILTSGETGECSGQNLDSFQGAGFSKSAVLITVELNKTNKQTKNTKPLPPPTTKNPSFQFRDLQFTEYIRKPKMWSFFQDRHLDFFNKSQRKHERERKWNLEIKSLRKHTCQFGCIYHISILILKIQQQQQLNIEYLMISRNYY